MWEVHGEPGLFERLPGIFGDTDLHPIDLVAEVVDLELEVLVGLWHELDERLNRFNLNDAELHDVDQSVDLRGGRVGRWEVVDLLNLSGNGQLTGLHLHVRVGSNDHLEVNFLTGSDVHVSGRRSGQSVAGHLDGDLFDVGSRV